MNLYTTLDPNIKAILFGLLILFFMTWLASSIFTIMAFQGRGKKYPSHHFINRMSFKQYYFSTLDLPKWVSGFNRAGIYMAAIELFILLFWALGIKLI